METLIEPRSLIIKDKGIISIIEGTKTRYLNIVIKKDYDNKFIISANIVSFYIENEISKSCIKIFYDNEYYIRTPDILLPFIGKKILYYRDNSIFKEQGELFRIKPLNFKLNCDGFSKVKLKDVPYFTKSGALVLPKLFVNNNFDNKILLYKLSFDSTDINVINEGLIYAYLFQYSERRFFSFRLRKTCMGLSTCVTSKLTDLVEKMGKNIESFKYAGFVKTTEYPQGLILFKEIKNGKRSGR